MFCTLHEYRIVYGLMGFTGFVTGLVDALIDDFAVKAFLWAFTLWLTLLVAVYELTVMPTPPRPFLQSLLLALLGSLGSLSIHHFTWLLTSVMVGREILNPLWLAPNIYVDLYAYTCAMALLLALYLAYLAYINLRSCD